MTDELDLDLKQLFDERLSRYRPPAPQRRRRARSVRPVQWTAGAAAAAAIALAGAGLALDVNAVAAGNGVDCANLVAKIRFWAEAKQVARANLTKERVADLMAKSGCPNVPRLSWVDRDVPDATNPKKR